MANILDYLDERGHIPFARAPFCAIDSLILSQLSYGGYERAAKALPAPLFEVAEAARDDFHRLDTQLLAKAAGSARFRKVMPFMYSRKYSEKATMQFAAVTFLLPDGTAYVAYRGTDNTIVGWKEDFNLSFTCPVPAQTEAVDYLNRVGDMLGSPLRVGGHSKGGNLAVYAAALCKSAVQERVIEVYSNDGPGHDLATLNSEGYGRIQSRIKTYIPRSSIVGMLLERREDYTVVDSDARGLFQHYPYTWLVDGGEFVTLEKPSLMSRCMHESVREWLKNMSVEKRKYMIDTVFDVLSAGEAKTLRELITNYSGIQPVLHKAAELTPEDRHEIFELTGQFMRIALTQYEQIALKQLTSLRTHFGDFVEKYVDRDDKRREIGGKL